jgi:AraC-like DNA-binding protein
LAAYLRRLAERAPFIADEERLERTTRAVLTAATLGDPKAIDEGAEALDDFIFEAATRFIDQNLQHEHLGVQGIAADLGVSRPTLYRVFRPINGVDAYIWNRRLRRAWELLIDPICDRSVLQISETLGFKDASHFTRRFKAEFGVRPSDIR